LIWIGITAAAVVLLSMLVFLYLRTKEYDRAGYFQNVSLLRQLKQLDERWELDVLKSRLGIDSGYSSLGDAAAGFDPLWERLQQIVTREGEPARRSLARVSEDYHHEVQEKIRLIEQFKSHNSLLRAALASLPTAADRVRSVTGEAEGGNPAGTRGSRSASGAPSHRTDTGSNVEKALLESMVYSQSPSDEKAASIEADLAQLTRTTAQAPGPLTEPLESFAAHVHTVLREQPEVNSLLASIATVPIAASLDELEGLLSSAKRRAELQAERDRKELLSLAAALAVLLLYAAVSLIRSHAVINRVNRELLAANETLEERVEKRTRELAAAQSELVSTARQAGMAEIATNVLHNIGNALNSVVVSAGLIGTGLRESKVKGFADAVKLMNEHSADLSVFMATERGKRLPGYLTKLAEILFAEKTATAHELESLIKGIDHIRDIVTTQQSYAGTRSVVEPVEVGALIEDALRMNAGSLSRRRVSVVKHWPDVPEALLDRHLILQVLINLIANALQAMDGVTDRPPRLALRAQAIDSLQRLVVQVEDNGEGITKENLARLFTHGFTTRKRGHGFGLHSCALAAQAMGGEIRAESPGPGQGALFTLELPLNETEKKAVANL
jgi:two-component system, NtrC family, sensor kinase